MIFVLFYRTTNFSSLLIGYGGERSEDSFFCTFVILQKRTNEIALISNIYSIYASVLRTFSDCSYAQPNEHISAHHYENFYKNLFHFYIRYSININVFIQVFLYNIKYLPSSLLPVEKITILLIVLFILLNDFLKMNTGSHIQTNFVLFLVISSFISHCFKILLKKFFYNE